MKNRKIILTILSILITMSSGIIFFLPAYFFKYSFKSKDTVITLTNKYINILEFKVLNQVENMYNALTLDFPKVYPIIFIALVIITLVSSLTMMILITISLFKHLNKKLTNIFPITSIVLSILTLTVALIFSHEATQDINNNTITINLTIGVYLFTILQVSGNAFAYITNSQKEN